MAELKNALLENGFQQVQTYIQSGNIVYQHASTSITDLNKQMNQIIQQKFGFDVPVLTLESKAFETIVRKNPFTSDTQKDTSCFHITFLSECPQAEFIAKIDASKYLPDEFSIVKNAVYLYCPGGYGNTKLSNKFLETKLKVDATTRNWKTVNELIRLAGESDM